jgi:hypothetical protein
MKKNSLDKQLQEQNDKLDHYRAVSNLPDIRTVHDLTLQVCRSKYLLLLTM